VAPHEAGGKQENQFGFTSNLQRPQQRPKQTTDKVAQPLMPQPRPESQSNRLQQFSVPQSGAAESTSVSACVSA